MLFQHLQIVDVSQISLALIVPEVAKIRQIRFLWHDEGKAYLAYINNLEVLEQHLANPRHHYYFAKLEDDTIAGYLKLIFGAPIPDTPFSNAVSLDKIYLSEAAKGKGIGRLLMEFADQQAQLAKAEYLWLRVMDSNAYNLDFYAKNGYKTLYKRWLELANIKEEHRGIFTMVKNIQ